MVVDGGLYVLRYVSTRAGEHCPFVKIRPEGAHSITFIAAPGGLADTLAAPGDCLVVRAETSGALHLTVSSIVDGGSLDAELKLERIATSQRAPVASFPHAVQLDVPAPDISVLAHVSRRGDVTLGPDEWVGGPDLPLAIEGLAVNWPNKPVDVTLGYTATIRYANQHRVVRGTAGEFAGTRGKAAPLVGLELSLGGLGAGAFQLKVDALFLGAAILSKTGDTISLAGPSGQEPLVGLRLSIIPRTISKKTASPFPSVVNNAPAGKVRIYRPAAALAVG